jgi:hypothetical protein
MEKGQLWHTVDPCIATPIMLLANENIARNAFDQQTTTSEKRAWEK